MVIYCTDISSRLEFVADFLSQFLGEKVVLTSDLGYEKEPICINYSLKEIKNSVKIVPHGLLSSTDIIPVDVTVFRWDELPAFFKTNDEDDIPFDMFSASFYLISRYEEYLNFLPDSHGRFPHTASLAFKSGFLDVPIVDFWLMKLKEIIALRTQIYFPLRTFRFIPTIDVDMAYAYLHKGLFVSFLTSVKAVLYGSVWDRFQVLYGNRKDPYDTFAMIEKMHSKLAEKPIFFFLLGKYGRYDKNNNPKSRQIIQLIQQIASHCNIGIHPSYRSNSDKKSLKSEKKHLEKITNQTVFRSRQHYLKLLFPRTYAQLVKNGITKDFTMGYPEYCGFRAGTCTPFQFFNLDRNCTEDLKIYPFAVMDSTMKHFLKLDINQAIALCKDRIAKVKKVDGTFISIWHNSSFSHIGDMEGWERVYGEMINLTQK